MTTDKFNIEKLAATAKPLETEVEFRDEMFLTVQHLPRPALQKLFKDSQTMKMDYKTRVRIPEVNPDLFAEKFCNAVVKDWRGFTPRKIANLIQLDLSSFTPEELDEQVPFSQQQVRYLVRNAYDLDSFLQEFCQDLSNFRPDKDYEEKNSETSQSGS